MVAAQDGNQAGAELQLLRNWKKTPIVHLHAKRISILKPSEYFHMDFPHPFFQELQQQQCIWDLQWHTDVLQVIFVSCSLCWFTTELLLLDSPVAAAI